ncbi:MAG TPA: hypothetical protein VMW91_04635 [Desulfosporosinus sp.]|nr:hypothetical protein [Desulfosporosinus sp.]
MALEQLKPEIWSAQLLRRLNDVLVFRNVCTTEFDQEISKFGDVIKINEVGTIDVNDYTATSTGALTIQSLRDAQKLLTIDRAKYTAFWIDQEDKAQAKPDVLNAAREQAAWSLGNEVDEYVASLYGQAGITVGGTITTGVDITSTNILKYFSLIAQKHDEANTPNVGRWVIVPPWMAHKLILSKIALDTANSGVLGQGKLGNYYGFDIYVSNNVYHAATAARGAVLSGYKGSIALATQVLLTQGMNTVTIGFKYLVKSLLVYGAKVIRPNNLGVLWSTYVAEAS